MAFLFVVNIVSHLGIEKKYLWQFLYLCLAYAGKFLESICQNKAVFHIFIDICFGRRKVVFNSEYVIITWHQGNMASDANAQTNIFIYEKKSD